MNSQKKQNGAVNISNLDLKCKFLLNYRLLYINKVLWKFFRTSDGKFVVFKDIFICVLIYMLKMSQNDV